MPAPKTEDNPIDPAVHKKLASTLFNHVWRLMETTDRTSAQDDEMLHAAHASRHHWGVVGSEVNWARGEWLIARVNAVLGHANAAVRHAERCLHWCESGVLGTFDFAYAHEAIARGAALQGDAARRDEHLDKARRRAEDEPDECYRKAIADDLATIAR